MEFIKYLVIFRDEKIPSANKKAYSSKIFDVPRSYIDDPLGWVAQQNPKEDIHIVVCVPLDGRQHIADIISGI
jgi:hypothetical protein